MYYLFVKYPDILLKNIDVFYHDTTVSLDLLMSCLNNKIILSDKSFNERNELDIGYINNYWTVHIIDNISDTEKLSNWIDHRYNVLKKKKYDGKIKLIHTPKIKFKKKYFDIIIKN